MANILAAMNAGWDTAGKQLGDFNNTRLNQLASQAYSAPEEARPGLLGQMARLDRSAAAQQQASFNSGDDRKLRLLTGGAQYMKQAIDSGNPAAVNGAWRAVRPALIRAGIATEDSLSQDWDPSYAETVHQVLAMGGGVGGASAPPSQFAALDLQAKAAGYQPGTQGYRDFFRRANGELARQSGAAIGYQKITGPDGREYLVATDPRGIGAQVVGDGTGYGSFGPRASGVQALQDGGQMQGMGAATPSGGLDFASDAQQFASLGIPVSSTVRTQERNAQVGGVGNSYHLTGEAMDIAPRNAQEKAQAAQYWRQRGYQVIDEGDHLHVEPPGRGMTTSRLQAGGGNPFASRRPEDQAAATERAKLQAQLQFLPQELAMRGQAAAEQAAATERAKAEVGREQEAIADLPKVRTEAQNMLTLIDRAIRHPGREIVTGMSGTFDPRSYMPGGQAADFRAILDQLAGSSFLQAFESLKGGGAITEMEGKKAEQARARLQTTQSDEGFLQALRDLREVTQSALQRAERQAAAAQPAPARNTTGAVRVQTADDYNRLPAGALYITPSGETRRKR